MIETLKKNILQKAAYFSENQRELLIKTISFAIASHEGQIRQTGEPYVTHPLIVCEILLDNKADIITLISSLLHDVVEDTNITITEIKDNFGEEVAFIVDGLTKINKDPTISKDEYNAINFEKLLLASEKDIRVAIVKIGDRLHNMRTLAVKKVQKKVPYANETLIFFAPLCERLGLFTIQQEIEELGYKFLSPLAYNSVKKRLQNYFNIFYPLYNIFKSELEKDGTFQIQVYWQQEPIYKSSSLLQEGHPFSDIYSIKVVTNNINDCYTILGIIHQLFPVIDNQFEDNIAIERSFSSKHLKTMICINDVNIKIIIQTEIQKKLFEDGIFHYLKNDVSKDKLKELSGTILSDTINSVKYLSNNPIEFYDLISYELFQKEVTIYTPKMDVIRLPEGSTAVDFAFALNPTIARKMTSIKINGVKYSIDTILNDLDIIQIVSGENDTVTSVWLNYGQTSKALKEISHIINT